MVSRSEGFGQVQNRFSIFLAQVRHILPRRRYDCLLSMRRGIDHPLRRHLDPMLEAAWLAALSQALDRAFRALEKGNPGRSGYLAIGHLYRDYFFALFSRATPPTSRKA